MALVNLFLLALGLLLVFYIWFGSMSLWWSHWLFSCIFWCFFEFFLDHIDCVKACLVLL